MKKAMGCLGWIVAAAVGYIVICIMMGPLHNAVSDTCRYTVANAAINVDGWIYIQKTCTDQEQVALIREFKRRGLDTSEIDRSRASIGKTTSNSID